MKQIYEFDGFRADPTEQILLYDGRPVALTPKVFDTLLVLLESDGRLIDKDDFINRLWPGIFVEDVALAKNISHLRKILAEGKNAVEMIQTVPKRGYRFTVPVKKVPYATPLNSAAERLWQWDSMAGPDSPSILPATQSLNAVTGGPRLPEYADSIAVFPFENIGREPDKEYLSDGLTETIINSLARLRRLRVVPRTTMFRYRERSADPIQAGRELRARIVLTGRVLERGERLVVDAELVDTANESQLWGAKYTRSLSDILAVQEEIVGEVSKRLRLQLSDEENECFINRPSQNREAYHLFVKGWYYANKWSPEGLAKGLAYTRQAIEADPAYAEPYAVLAYVYCMLGHFGTLAPADAFPKAKAAALKALEIDETFASVHFSLGLVHLLYDWDWSGAESEIQRGLQLAPNDAAGHFAYGEWFTAMGRFEEAIVELERALDLDPLSSPISANLAAAYSFVRKFDRAIEQIRKTIELDPSFMAAQALLAVLLSRAGYHDEGVVEAQKCVALPGSDLRGNTTMGLVYANAGRTEEANRIAVELESQPKLRRLSSGLPYIYGALGDRDRAMQWLEEAYLGRVSNLAFLCQAPELKSLRGDPRFEDLRRRIGFPA